MNFLTLKAVPTSEPGICYRVDFEYGKAFPESQELNRELERLMLANPDEDPAELVKLVDPALMAKAPSQRARAEKLLKSAFCDKDGEALKFEGRLSDYQVARVNALYDSVVEESRNLGKPASAPTPAGTSPTS